MRRFYFHYNKPASKAAGYPKMSVHFADKCHIVDHVRCHIPCESLHKNKQPKCVMRGMANRVAILRTRKQVIIAEIT